jgi:DegV family protein with EDD domain
MEQRVSVVTDSSCDLPRRLVERLKIAVVPLVVRFGSEEHDEGELTRDEFWDKAAGPHHPQTSQPSVGRFEQVFESLVARGREVLCVTITSKHSGTFNSAILAARRFGEAVKVFDSASLSLGLGLQVVTAAEAALAGHPLQEILALVEDLRERMQLTILLNTLENLRRGGRADGFIPIVDRMTRVLNVKVLINVVDGQLKLLSAARSFEGGLRRLLNIVDGFKPLEHLAVIHIRRPALAEEMADRLAARIGFPRERIMVGETGAALSTHGGVGVIGVVAVPVR